jgi:xanthosine utilization system XapX-like protein
VEFGECAENPKTLTPTLSRSTGRGGKAVAVFVAIFLFAQNVIAQSIRLPLDGYYRPGEYMPVRVEANSEMMLQTDGVMNTRISHGGIAPVFTMSATADQLKTGGPSVSIHSLQPDEKLVGSAGPIDRATAQRIFPGARIISVSLNSADPLPGPAVAWSSLDAVVLDALPKNFADFLPTGMTLAVRSANPPDRRLAWRHVADAWVLSADLLPAHPALLGEDAYLPTESWTPQMPAQLRELIVLVAVLVCCLMLATVFSPVRWRLPALAAVAVISSVGILVWKNHQPAAMELSGVISHDKWIYQTTLRGTEITMPMDGVVYPVFASAAHAGKVHAMLDADRDVITCQLPAQATMAFVQRFAGGAPSSTDSSVEQFLPLARRAYLAPGTALRIENNRIVIDHITR